MSGSLKLSPMILNIEYKITDKLIKFNSLKSRINNQDIFFNGDINISPFYYQLQLDLQSLNIKKLQKYLPRIKNLLDEKILLNKNINGKILINNCEPLEYFKKLASK